MKKQHFIINYGIYPFDVLVSIGEETEDVINFIEKFSCKLTSEEKLALRMEGRGRTVMLGGGQTILRVKTEDYAIISHEVFHAIEFLMDRIGAKLTVESAETYAYAIEYMTREIMKRIKVKK